MIGIDVNKCNGNPESCPTLQQVFDDDAFCEQMSGVWAEDDAHIATSRKMLGDYATSCAIGACIGQNQQTARDAMRSFLERKNDTDS